MPLLLMFPLEGVAQSRSSQLLRNIPLVEAAQFLLNLPTVRLEEVVQPLWNQRLPIILLIGVAQ